MSKVAVSLIMLLFYAMAVYSINLIMKRIVKPRVKRFVKRIERMLVRVYA
jgi:hypothetical protein